MQSEDFLSDEFLKQFKTGQQLNDFLSQIQKRAIEKMLEGELDGLESKWSSKYAYAIKSWRDNWEDLSRPSSRMLNTFTTLGVPYSTTDLRTSSSNESTTIKAFIK